MATAIAVTPSAVQNIAGLLGANQWQPVGGVTTLNYNFPGLDSYYPANYFTAGSVPASYTFDINAVDSVAGNGTFVAATQAMKDAYAAILPQVSKFAPIVFNLQADNAAASGVDISVARALLPNDDQTGTITGHAYRPSNVQRGGDTWYSTNSYYGGNPANGDFFAVGVSAGGPGWFVMLHEIGHSLGLKHAHEDGTLVTADRDGYEYTVMTYRDYVGDDANRGWDGERYGRPQTMMMLDIQALQYLYGAKFDATPVNSVYTFSTTTGQMFINGVGEAVPGANRIFRTIWDGGGTDTYDLSNYTTSLSIDLAPGGWSTFDQSQLAIVETTTGRRAIGNVANALQYNGDARSLIENAAGGSGNDSISGNDAANALTGNGGSDTLAGGNGNDTLDGGTGSDRLDGGANDDTIVWDAGDQLAFVLGGTGTDTLRVINQAAPTSFGLAAHGFERATVITDDTGGNWWQQITDTYNASWQRTNSDTRADNGNLVQTTYDVSAGGTGVNWQYISDYRNAASVLTNQDGQFDNGGTFAKSYDYAAGTGTDGISDELREFTYFFRNVTEQQQGKVLNVEGFYDDGRKFTQTNDVDANQAWTFQTNWYETNGTTLDFLEIRWDNGTTQIIPY